MDAAVDWVFRNFWIVWVVTIIAVAICGTRNEFLARKRTAQVKCARCGRDLKEEMPPEQVELAGQDMLVLMCPSCKARTLRNYRAVYYVMLLGLMSALVVSIVEVLARDTHVTWKDIRVLLEVLSFFAPLGIVLLWIRKSLKRPAPNAGKLES